MQVLTAHPELQVLGANLRAWIDNPEGDMISPILEARGMTNIIADQWYSVQDWLDTLNVLAETNNMSGTYVAIGMAIGKIVQLPPEMTLSEALMGWGASYKSLHRGPEMGNIDCEKISETHYVTKHTHPYPDDFSYGICYGYAKRFLPRGTGFKVYYDPNVTRRDEGGNVTVIHIEW